MKIWTSILLTADSRIEEADASAIPLDIFDVEVYGSGWFWTIFLGWPWILRVFELGMFRYAYEISEK